MGDSQSVKTCSCSRNRFIILKKNAGLVCVNEHTLPPSARASPITASCWGGGVDGVAEATAAPATPAWR